MNKNKTLESLFGLPIEESSHLKDAESYLVNPSDSKPTSLSNMQDALDQARAGGQQPDKLFMSGRQMKDLTDLMNGIYPHEKLEKGDWILYDNQVHEVTAVRLKGWSLHNLENDERYFIAYSRRVKKVPKGDIESVKILYGGNSG